MDISVVIPNHNRKHILLQTLSALSRCEFPSDCWELIIVDDGSTDDSVPAIIDFSRTFSFTVRCISIHNSGPATARNRGAAEAIGRFLIFLDNDIIVNPDFLRLHFDALLANPKSWIIGRITHSEDLRSTPFGRYRHDLWETFHREHLPNSIQITVGITAANLSLPRDDFQKLGGFDTSFSIASCEDWDLGFRARNLGIIVLYYPRISVIHNDWAINLDKFCERQLMYAISDVQLWLKHGDTIPRYDLICENKIIVWCKDPFFLIIRKSFKSLLSFFIIRKFIHILAWLSEFFFPDTSFTIFFYRLAISIAIFRGVRDGTSRYSVR